MCDLGLRLEHRAQEVGVAAVQLDDLLELVEDHDDATAPVGRDPAEQLEQRLDRVVDVRSAAGRAEAEASEPSCGSTSIDGTTRKPRNSSAARS